MPMSESSVDLFGSKKSVKLEWDTYYLLKRVADDRGLKVAAALEEAVRRYCLVPGGDTSAPTLQALQSQITSLQQQMDQFRSSASSFREDEDPAPVDHPAKHGRQSGRTARKDKVMTRVKSLVKSRRTHTAERLAFLFLVFDSKPKKGLSRDFLRDSASDLWALSLKHECLSWGVVLGHLEESLLHANAIDRRQRADFLDLRGGDIVIATWGKVVLGWGFVKPNPANAELPSYMYRDPELAALWKRNGEWYTEEWQDGWGWFQHTVRVDWRKQWEFGEVSLPGGIPAQPTLRRPRPDREDSWQIIRDLGVPVDNHGVVTA